MMITLRKQTMSTLSFKKINVPQKYVLETYPRIFGEKKKNCV